MKTQKNKILFFGAFIVAAALITFGRGWASGDASVITDKKQAIKFSHSKHAENGVECATCHSSITESVSTKENIFPGHNECQSCHEDKVTSECAYCHVNSEDPKGLPKPIREISFNHKFHMQEQKMECVTCHQGMEKTDFATAVNHPSMATCNTCHNNVKANNECETCHLNIANLRPASHSVVSFKKEHGRMSRLRTMDAQCQSCHSNNFCEQCHDGNNLTKLNPKEAMGLISPRASGNINSLALKGQMVHDINFRFTHGIEAKGKAADCQSCHRTQEFCADCHRNGSAALGGAIPTSHEKAGFVTLGVGSGGGTHAALAKRDINRCISCHDAEGGDPTCTMCHSDPDGVKGTNPKTHKIGFMKNVQGEWHDEMGANCFVCHTDSHAKNKSKAGVGFCGYCHGTKK